MSRIIPFSVTVGSPGVTMSVGVANADTKIVEFQVQPGMNLVLDEMSVIQIKDDGATETADSSYVRIQVVAPNNDKTVVLQRTTYGTVKFSQDTRIRNRPGVPLRVGPFNLLQVYIKGSQALATTTTRFELQAKAEVN